MRLNELPGENGDETLSGGEMSEIDQDFLRHIIPIYIVRFVYNQRILVSIRCPTSRIYLQFLKAFNNRVC